MLDAKGCKIFFSNYFICKQSTMHKKVCQGCGHTFAGSNQKELDKLLKLHWDFQNPSLAKCKYCSFIVHANDDDLVKKRLLEHKKFCKKQNDTIERMFLHAKI